MKQSKKMIILFVSFTLFHCSSQKPDIDVLLEWMTGSFSSSIQAKSDTNFYDIRLEMKQIWKDRNDGPWIYVEQAAANSIDKPYRQRIYQLVQTDDFIKSVVYSIKNPLRFAGEYKKNEPLQQLNHDSLFLRKGCSVYLKRIAENTFSGSTKDKECESKHRGADYASSEVTIKPDRIISWDRGFNENDTQVWGSEKGGYIFIKVK